MNQTCVSLMIEGNIGVGKSTFLRVVGEQFNVVPIYEPAEKWQTVGDNGQENLLAKFYQDTKRWAYTFQTYAFVTRVVEQGAYARQYPGQIQLLERSVYADRYCFARNCFEMGTMSGLEWQLYKEWFAWLVDNYTIKPQGFIYLRAEPEICHARMVQRSRSAEQAVPLDYLRRLHEKHEEWLIQKKDVAPYIRDIPVLTLDCSADFEHDKEEQEKHCAAIMNFFSCLRLKEVPIGVKSWKDHLPSNTLQC